MDFTVFAGCFDEKSYGALGLQSIGNETGRLHVLKLDVTSNDDVNKAREYVESHLPPLGMWGVVNNAGQYIIGFLEWLAMEDYKKVCTLVLWGETIVSCKTIYEYTNKQTTECRFQRSTCSVLSA